MSLLKKDEVMKSDLKDKEFSELLKVTGSESLEYCFKNFPYITRILKSGYFKDKMYGSFKTKRLKKLKYYKITGADFIAYSYDLLPCVAVEKHKPVGILAHSITHQNQYLGVAEHCDNIIFRNFKPTI